ncbi:MAG: DUF3108 domain-containing protein [Chitinophagaceae bacterium]|nr:DUF3108 domain-containing protein [Chitinophagaceae bacterium]MCW5913396.1 DUF3108 domain-containing protein [Chitinophagaceae bacterium]
MIPFAGNHTTTTSPTFFQEQADEFCYVPNTSFKPGEEVTMKVYYSTLGIYIGAGEAKFSVGLSKMNGRPVYHCLGVGTSYSFFDKFFRVRDRYESYIDTATMLPVKFIRNVDEDGYKIYNNVTFNHENRTAVTTNGLFKVTPCIQDVISSVYYARNIDFSKYRKGEKIKFDMFLDDEVYNMYIKYEGKETVKTRYGKFRAIKFKPLLIKGSIFEGGEKMNVWISDDKNRILLRAESPIAVGSIKVDMMGYRNLRHPLTSLISVR